MHNSLDIVYLLQVVLAPAPGELGNSVSSWKTDSKEVIVYRELRVTMLLYFWRTQEEFIVEKVVTFSSPNFTKANLKFLYTTHILTIVRAIYTKIV